MLLIGHGPFNVPTEPGDAVALADWFSSPGTDRFDCGFYWMLPLSVREHDRAQVEGTPNVFADIVAQAPPEAKDDCYVAFDLMRTPE